MLIKLKIQRKGKQSTLIFISKRVIHLESSLLPFLLFCGAVYMTVGIDFQLRLTLKISSCWGGLPSYRVGTFMVRHDDNGLLCHVQFLRKYPERYKWIWLWLLFIPLQVLLEMAGYPRYFFLVLMYCGLAFIYAKEIMQRLCQTSICLAAIISLFVNALAVCLLKCGVISIGHLPYYYVTVLSGISMFALLFKLF